MKSAEQEFLDGQEGEMYTTFLAHLKAASSNRWHYDKIDYCWTGKDADLDTHGYQGLHLDRINDEWVWATVHCGKTVAGDDVCLNVPQSNKIKKTYEITVVLVEKNGEAVSIDPASL